MVNWFQWNSSMQYLLKIATASLLPVHHVVENGDHDISQIRLRHQRHLQERPNHCWDEVQLMFTWRKDTDRHRGQAFTLSLHTAYSLCQRQFTQLWKGVFLQNLCNKSCSSSSWSSQKPQNFLFWLFSATPPF